MHWVVSLRSYFFFYRGRKSASSYGRLNFNIRESLLVSLKPPWKWTQHCWPTTHKHCWAQHIASVCMKPQQCWHLLAFVAYSLKPVKLLGHTNGRNIVGQQHATMLWLVAPAVCMGVNKYVVILARLLISLFTENTFSVEVGDGVTDCGREKRVK